MILVNFHRQRRRFNKLPKRLTSEALALLDLASYLESLPDDPAHVSPWETMREASQWWERRTDGHEILPEGLELGHDLVQRFYEKRKLLSKS